MKRIKKNKSTHTVRVGIELSKAKDLASSVASVDQSIAAAILLVAGNAEKEDNYLDFVVSSTDINF